MDPTLGPQTRVIQIIQQGRGITGASGSGGNTFSTHAQLIGIPVGTFRRSENRAPLEDMIDGPAFDRAFDVRWREVRAEEGINEFDQNALRTFLLDVRVGFMSGKALAAMVKVVGGETAATAVIEPEARAIGASIQLDRALTFGELYQGTDISPSIMRLKRAEGIGTTTQTLPGGRIIFTSTYLVRVEINLTQNSAP